MQNKPSKEQLIKLLKDGAIVSTTNCDFKAINNHIYYRIDKQWVQDSRNMRLIPVDMWFENDYIYPNIINIDFTPIYKKQLDDLIND